MWAISGTNGSSGLGSVSKEQMDSNTYSEMNRVIGSGDFASRGKYLTLHALESSLHTLEIVKAGLHCSFRMSKQMLP